MSEVEKMLLIEKVSIRVGKMHAEALLPKDAAENLLLFIKNCQVELYNNNFIKKEEIDPTLKDPAHRVAACLRGARHKAQLSQVELAERINITQSDLSKMEHGKRPIGKKLALKLAKILDVDYRLFL